MEGLGYNSEIKQMQIHTLKEYGYNSDIKMDLSHSSQRNTKFHIRLKISN